MLQGLLFPIFKQLNQKHVPTLGTLITGVGTALIAFFVSLEALADAISVGTLLAFTIVNAGVVILRIRNEHNSVRVFGLLGIFSASVLVVGFGLHYSWPTAVLIVFAIIALLCVTLLSCFEIMNLPISFKCPFVPWVPCAGIAINLGMMTGLNSDAWVRLGIWTLVGVAMYFGYGIWHSGLYIKRYRAMSDTNDGMSPVPTKDSKLSQNLSLPKNIAESSPVEEATDSYVKDGENAQRYSWGSRSQESWPLLHD